MNYHMVFDVESLGLHGEGFAVAYVVINGTTGKKEEEGLFSCPPSHARFAATTITQEHAFYLACSRNLDWVSLMRDSKEGTKRIEDWEWIQKNVVPHLPLPTHPNPRGVRNAFWDVWSKWSNRGADLWAEWGWPVEARFLAACVDDNLADRMWGGPSPLKEIAVLMAGMSSKQPRLSNELPPHNPLADARQSARLLWEQLQKKG